MTRKTTVTLFLELQAKGLPVTLRKSGKLYCIKCLRRVRQTNVHSAPNCKHMIENKKVVVDID